MSREGGRNRGQRILSGSDFEYLFVRAQNCRSAACFAGVIVLFTGHFVSYRAETQIRHRMVRQLSALSDAEFLSTKGDDTLDDLSVFSGHMSKKSEKPRKYVLYICLTRGISKQMIKCV